MSKDSKHLSSVEIGLVPPFVNGVGGPDRIRTGDLIIANDAL